jgi:hypothetical protein|tara:strand:+ start:80 stop:694 length:615 start_codon:yes stop_codon:yes gene_type:complete
MANIRKDFRFKLVKSFLNNDELNVLKNYALYRLEFGQDFVIFDYGVAPYTLDFSEDALMNSILRTKTKKVEKLVGLKLFPTYAYWRWYPFGSKLTPHRDRPSCEISLTINLYKDKNWPMLIDNNEVEIDSGDGVIYLGIEDVHARKGEYQGEAFAQLFMHYVDQNGFFTHHANDSYRKEYHQTETSEDTINMRKLRNAKKKIKN